MKHEKISYKQSLKKWSVTIFFAVPLLTVGSVYAGESYLELGSSLKTIQLCDGGASFKTVAGEEGLEQCYSEVVNFNQVLHVPNNIASGPELEQCINDLTGGGRLLQAVEVGSLEALTETNFFEGFQLWWKLAKQNHDSPDVLTAFPLVHSTIIRMFVDLSNRGDGEILLIETAVFDGGQSDYLYIYDMVSGQFSILLFSCG